MQNIPNLKPGDKVGYLNPRTGKYKYVPIIETNIKHPKTWNLSVKLCEKFNGYNDNIYFEELINLTKFSQTLDSEGFNKPVIKLLICK